MASAGALPVDPSNADAFAAWDGGDGDYWAEHADLFDRSLTAYGPAFSDAIAVTEHDRVLDVGCGNGQTTRDAARCATSGSALGIDLSSRMIEQARQARHGGGDRERVVPAGRRAGPRLRRRGLRRRDQPNGRDVLRRSEDSLLEPGTRAATRGTVGAARVAWARGQRLDPGLLDRARRRPRSPDPTRDRARPIRALRPQARPRHPDGRRVHRHRVRVGRAADVVR